MGVGRVDEYTADDPVEDSDDEKRIRKVERAAVWKAGKSARGARLMHLQPGCAGANHVAQWPLWECRTLYHP